MATFNEITCDLKLPEGPIALADGSVLVVEMFGPGLTCVRNDGTKEVVARIPGGPNGAAIGPDGAVYVCNNGGCYTETTMNGLCTPDSAGLATYLGGSIQRVDARTGEVANLYTSCGDNPLRAPNDVVFDGLGGFYFTDSGIIDGRVSRLGGIYYAEADGSRIVEVSFPVVHPNGIGLSPDGSTLYWAETWNGRLIRREIISPGVVAEVGALDASACLYGFGGYTVLDSLAVDSEGNVCVATCAVGGIAVVSPQGELVEFIETGDIATTNICFGGGSMRWPRPGGELHHLRTLDLSDPAPAYLEMNRIPLQTDDQPSGWTE